MALIDLMTTVASLGEAVADLDTEASLSGNAEAYQAVARLSATILEQAGRIKRNPDWMVDQANLALAGLATLAGWVNQLGPRFE
jgi:hypothetical protein